MSEAPSHVRLPGFPWSGLFHGTTTRHAPPEFLPPRSNHAFRSRYRPPTDADWIALNQTHTREVAVISQAEDIRRWGDRGCDAAVTDNPNIVLTLQTADCVPVFLYDPRGSAIALVHSGWRGTAAGIVEGTLEWMAREFSTQPGNLWIGLGPSIRGPNYEVGEEVAHAIRPEGDLPTQWLRPNGTPGKWQLDLHGCLRSRLERLGIGSERIAAIEECTAATPELYYSFRARPGEKGRMLSYLSLRSPPSVC